MESRNSKSSLRPSNLNHQLQGHRKMKKRQKKHPCKRKTVHAALATSLAFARLIWARMFRMQMSANVLATPATDKYNAHDEPKKKKRKQCVSLHKLM